MRFLSITVFNISAEETKLTSFNSKSCVHETFKKYVNKKNMVNKVLLKKYKNKIFRQYKWYGYINRRKTESWVINEIKKTFGKNVTLVYGDWSAGQQMRNLISTPNLGLKRKIGEQLKVYSIDEFRTSSVNCHTKGVNENIYLPDKKGLMRKMHSILTYKMRNERKGCINRDHNAVENMIKITDQFIKMEFDQRYSEENIRGI